MGKTIAERPRTARQPSRPSKSTAGRDSRKDFHRYIEDTNWVEEHREELLARYPEQWIAVLRKRVIASNPDLTALRNSLPDPHETYIKFLTRDPVDIVLGCMFRFSEEPDGMGRPARTRPRKKLPPLTPVERAEAMERLRTFDEDGGWIDEHYQELLAQYPEEWVAVLNKRLIAHDPDFDSLLRKVPDPPHTNIWFITRNPQEILL